MNETITGIVKWFDVEKGYGFLRPDNGTEDVFVHHSAINADGFRKLEDGQRVEFSTEPGRKGLQAVNVTALAEAAAS